MKRAGRVVARISVGHRKLKLERGNAQKKEGKSSRMGLQQEMKAGANGHGRICKGGGRSQEREWGMSGRQRGGRLSRAGGGNSG